MTTQTTPSQPWVWRSNGPVPVSGEGAKSANAVPWLTRAVESRGKRLQGASLRLGA